MQIGPNAHGRCGDGKKCMIPRACQESSAGAPVASDMISLLRQQAVARPEQTAFTFLADGEVARARLTYAELDVRARAIAATLRDRTQPGERALLLYPSGLDYVAAFFGCLYAGVIAVPAYPPRLNRRDGRIAALARDCRPCLALTDQATGGVVREWQRSAALASIPAPLTTDNIGNVAASSWTSPRVAPGTLAFLQYTSGSTASPRGVMVTHGNLLRNSAEIAAGIGASPDDVIVSWLPLFHDLGLIGQVIQSVYAGASCVLMSPAAFTQRPLRWLQALTRHRGTIAFAPNFAYDACVDTTTPEQRAALDLSAWRVALNGAEPVRARTLRRFAAVFESCGFRAGTFLPAYGLAEATLVVSAGPPTPTPTLLDLDAEALGHGRATSPGGSSAGAVRTVAGCGRQLPSQEVVIVEPTTRVPAAPTRIGEIWVRGPCVADGYWERPDETAETFQARLAGSGDGLFLRTGDLGFVRDGIVYVAGRRKDLIIIHGRNIHPQDVEAEAESAHPALRRGATAALSLEARGEECLAVMLEVRRTHRRHLDTEGVLRAVRQAIATAFELPVHTIGLLPPGTIPKTSSGKIMRRDCRQRYLEGQLPFLAHWRSADAKSAAATSPGTPAAAPAFQSAGLRGLTPTARRDAVRGVIVSELARAAGLPATAVDTRLDFVGFGLDSLAIAGLAHAIGRRLPAWCDCTPATLFAHSTADSLAEHLAYAAERDGAAQPRSVNAAAGAPEGADQGLCRASFAQERFWFMEQWTPGPPLYHLPVAIDIPATVCPDALRQALNTLVRRHEALRTQNVVRDGRLFLSVRENAVPTLSRSDARGADSQVDDLVRGLIRRPFDLAGELPIRFDLLDTGATHRVLILTLHHAVADGISLNMLVGELVNAISLAAAGGDLDGDAPAAGFREHALRERESIDSPACRAALIHWRERLAGLPPLDLPTDRPRPATQTHAGAAIPVAIQRDAAAAVRAFARREGLTPFTCLASALFVVLYRYTGQTDIALGTPVGVRTSPDTAASAGCFVNTLVLRARIDVSWTVRDLLRHVQGLVTDALAHQAAPFDWLVRQLNPERDPSRTPFFQVMLALQADAADLTWHLRNAGSTWRDLRPELGVAQFDLTLDLTPTPAGLRGFAEYNTDIFDAWRIERFVEHYETCLQRLIVEPDRRLAEVSILPPHELQTLVMEWNATDTDEAGDCLLHEFVAAQARRTPAAIAVCCGSESVTYAALMSRVNRMAGRLQRLGVGPGALVGVCLERSVDMVVALLGVLRAGGAYVPIDPHFPRTRIQALLAHAAPQALVTDNAMRRRFFAAVARDVIGVDSDAPESPIRPDESPFDPDEPPRAAVTPENLAYVIYTSGSTGTPKGVQVTHGAIVNLLRAMSREPGMRADDALLAVTTVAFDIAALELFLPLIVGGRVIVAPRDVTANANALAAALTATGATIMQATPALWRMLLLSGWRGQRNLKILCGGEALPADLAAALRRCGDSLWNLYGPTETTVWSTVHKVNGAVGEPAAGGCVPIGRPIANTRIHILDRDGLPTPVGVPGELVIGGAGVARGYLGSPEMTSERFVPNPFDRERYTRLYRTGDLARRMPDGVIHFLGRLDDQLKVRGFRIEPAEVEAALASLPGIDQAVVVARRDGSGEMRLVAYLRGRHRDDGPIDVVAIRSRLAASLPDYMIPGVYVGVTAFPLTPNGKIDRRALPDPDTDRFTVAPRLASAGAAAERRLAAIWSEVLAVPDVGVRENFFNLGGHSLLMAQVHARLLASGCTGVSIVDLFQHPTIESLAAFLDGRAPSPQGRSVANDGGDRRSARATIASQQRLRRSAARALARRGVGEPQPKERS